MKLNGYLKGKGKLGNIVCARVAGETIARDYNPYVANPNTVPQLNQRARFKLAAQIAAALADVIVIAKDGLKSSRNQFVSKNNDAFSASNGVAQVSYENLQLTDGNLGLPSIIGSRDAQTGLVLQLSESAEGSVSRVVYIVYKKTAEETLQYKGSKVVAEAGEDGTFKTTFEAFDGELVLFAYGMRDRSASATAKYGNYQVENGIDLAKLVMTRKLSSGDFQYTRTRGTTIFSGDAGTIDAGENQHMVYITAEGPGSVSGEGFTSNRKAVDNNAQVVLTATPNEGCVFVGWRKNGEHTYITANNPATFVVQSNLDIIGVFNNPGSSTGDPGGSEE